MACSPRTDPRHYWTSRRGEQASRSGRRQLAAGGGSGLGLASVGGQPAQTASAATVAVDAIVNGHQSAPSVTIAAPALTTHQSNELLVAFVSSDGPSASAMSFSALAGGGLTWSRRARSNGQPGTAEIWQAVAASPVTGMVVTATRASGSFVGSITVVAFSGASTTVNGATATGSAATGAPSTSLTTTAGGSWTWAVGSDWSTATSHVPGAGQTIVDQFLA